jgi:hypothetical protein
MSIRSQNNVANDVIVSSVSPFILVLNQQFDPRWVLTDSSGISHTHIEVNGFANGWIISTPGTFHFALTFGPQRYYDLALIVSLVAAIVTISVIVIPPSMFSAIIMKRNSIERMKGSNRNPKIQQKIGPTDNNENMHC